MNLTGKLALFLGALMWCGCEPAATFSEAQPAGVRSRTSFPKNIQGTYLATDSVSTLHVSSQAITRACALSQHKDSLKGYTILPGGTLLDLRDSSREQVVIRNDSVIVAYTDTLFLISETNQLKKFKGFYFLNEKKEDRKWEVRKLSLKNKWLTVSWISSPEEIKTLQEITEAQDSTTNNFELTRRQFRHFVRKRGFSESDSFLRIRSTP